MDKDDVKGFFESCVYYEVKEVNSIYCMLKLEKADILRYFRMNLSRSEGCEPYLIQLKLEELGIE